jgi:hypothetical protein
MESPMESQVLHLSRRRRQSGLFIASENFETELESPEFSLREKVGADWVSTSIPSVLILSVEMEVRAFRLWILLSEFMTKIPAFVS